MIRTTLVLLLAAVLFTTVCTPELHAQTKTLKFTLEGDTALVQQGGTPTVTPGEKLMVEISNVTKQKSSWTFTFVDKKLSPNEPSEETPLRFTSERIPQLDAEQAELIFKDTSEVVSYDDDNSSIFIPVQGAGQTIDEADPEQNANGPLVRLRETYDRADNEINLYFDTKGLLYQSRNSRQPRTLPEDVDDNDVVNIFLVGQKEEIEDKTVNVTGTFADDDINIQGSSALADLSKSSVLQATGEDKPPKVVPMGTFGPYAPPSITIEIKKASSNSTIRSYTLPVNQNYIAGFRFMVGRSNIQFNDYEVQQFQDLESTGIKNVSDADGEPRYFLNIVFYSWQFWNDRFWNGRDLEETPRLLDRINPYVGVGLKNVGKEFQAGLSFEIARGLDVNWGVHIAKTKVLDGGFSEGDPFTGADKDIPTAEEWTVDANMFGLSVDLRIATEVLGNLFSSDS